MRKYFEKLYGNSSTVEFFVSAMAKGSVAHAYIIEGDRGSGKFLLAKCLSSMLAHGDKELSEKIHAMNCQDVSAYGLPEKKKFIPVETIRNIKREAYIKPGELDIRVFIIEDAHTMTAAGQNALLKLLEEPPEGVYFFLLCENSASLLPTVRSRAPVVRMERLGREKILEYANDNGIQIDKSSEDDILEKANGSIGALLTELEKSGESKEKYSLEDIMSALAERDFTALLCSVTALPSERRQLEAALSSLGELICKNGRQGNGALSVKTLIKIYSCVDSAMRGAEYNMNTQILKVTLAKQMMRAAMNN